jgi:hypothetical protein
MSKQEAKARFIPRPWHFGLNADRNMQNGTRIFPQQMQRLIGSVIWLEREERPAMDWKPIDTAPFGQDLQLSVIENGEVHALVFPCRRSTAGWSHGHTHAPVPVRPTHWRLWTETPGSV